MKREDLLFKFFDAFFEELGVSGYKEDANSSAVDGWQEMSIEDAARFLAKKTIEERGW